ncbi:Na+/H+ antiporter [Schlesneria paludicola]|uniref:Na+/H+ antiporter n=1 Tax=Schlesneria paludicola TaxID=360056 RepID=UPI00029AED87|nr:Na+/H+ antiporter [Schlesneria paludicola]
MNPVEVVIGLIFVATVLAAVAQRVGVAYPIVLVLGGLLVSFLPGIPLIHLDPEVVLLVFIPPLVYLPASQVALMDFRTSWFPISMLSIGLVLVTLFGIAGLVHLAMPQFAWSSAFVLAAVVAPTDMIAVNAIIRRTPIPHSVARILDGESLFNDVIAFVAYKIAVRAVLHHSFSFAGTLAEFTWDSVAGVAAGLLIGQLAIWSRRRVHDPAINAAISLLTSFAAYLTGEALQASGVLATVTAGLWVGRSLSRILEPETRQGSFSFWAGLNFILEGLAFVLIGLELRPILAELAPYSTTILVGLAVLISAGVILLRLLWIGAAFAVRLLVRRVLGMPSFQGSWKNALIIGWSGARGVDSLAAALGIPLLLADRLTPFPDRALILYLSFVVILVTLLLQGATLPVLIRWLTVSIDDAEAEESRFANIATVQAALRVLEQAQPASDDLRDLTRHLQRTYENRLTHLQTSSKAVTENSPAQIIASATSLRLAILKAKRETLIELRDQGRISNTVLRRIERSLDFEEIQLSS